MIGRVRSGGGHDRNRVWSAEYFGYQPYPGTVNIDLDTSTGEVEGEPAYDVYVCRRAALNGIDGHVCGRRSLTRQVMVFFIAPVNVREALNLKDGDRAVIILKE